MNLPFKHTTNIFATLANFISSIIYSVASFCGVTIIHSNTANNINLNYIKFKAHRIFSDIKGSKRSWTWMKPFHQNSSKRQSSWKINFESMLSVSKSGEERKEKEKLNLFLDYSVAACRVLAALYFGSLYQCVRVWELVEPVCWFLRSFFLFWSLFRLFRCLFSAEHHQHLFCLAWISISF